MENEEIKEKPAEKKKLELKSIFTGDNLKNLIIFAGILGIALIFISSFTGSRSEEKNDTPAESHPTAEEYTDKLETELSKIISTIDGAGKANVLITIDREIEHVYQTDNDTQTKTEASSSLSTSKQTTVIIKGKNNAEEPIKVTEIMPKIKGVLVVCDGADSSVVKQNITESVRVALGVSSSRVTIQPTGGKQE